jgi:3-methyladenine DNA glycosylase/8-oxoguanine DNA glycosylase
MSRTSGWRGTHVYTIGHSTRTLEELVTLLRAFDVSVLVDVRAIPRSCRNPQFNRDSLRAALRPRGLRYVHLSELGGRRRARKKSPNAGWRNAGFRGFADHMLTAGFRTGLADLRVLTATGKVALMCAEAVPWRCHRSLIADALIARGAQVEHITSARRSTSHRLTPFARLTGSLVTYPEEEVADGRLSTRAPFHLEATVRVLQRLPTNRVDLWESGRYLRVLASADNLALVTVENRGTVDAPDVRFAIRWDKPARTTHSGLAQTLRRILGLDVDPEPLRRVAERDRTVRSTARSLRGMRPPRFPELFEAFANVVPFQQVSLEAGVAVVGRFVERFGRHLEQGARRFHAFPTASTIAQARLEALRECGLSPQKAASLRYLARAIESGELAEARLSRMSTEDALRTLTELPGIGPWTAALVLLRGLGRIDVFPPGDVGAARRLRELVRLGPRASLDGVIERFGVHRGYLYFLALGGSLLAKGLIHAAPE